MTKAVFTHKPGSIYDDLPEQRYHFPRRYLRAAQKAVGDWIVYYEPRRGTGAVTGRQSYFAIARVRSVEPDKRQEGYHYAFLDNYIEFPTAQRFEAAGDYFEVALQRPDGGTNKGKFGWSIRQLPDNEFVSIVQAGFAGVRDSLGGADWASDLAQTDGAFGEPTIPFIDDGRPIVERLTQRPFREAAFARQIKKAYDHTCAATGLCITNGGGRPEVEAAHIRAVEDQGPDSPRNGIALSRTAHWMFDRGLISFGDDGAILVKEDKVPPDAARLLRPERRLLLPHEAALRPHPAFLAYHRRKFDFM